MGARAGVGAGVGPRVGIRLRRSVSSGAGVGTGLAAGVDGLDRAVEGIGAPTRPAVGEETGVGEAELAAVLRDDASGPEAALRIGCEGRLELVGPAEGGQGSIGQRKTPSLGGRT